MEQDCYYEHIGLREKRQGTFTKGSPYEIIKETKSRTTLN